MIDRLGGGEAAPAGGPATPPALGDDLLPPVPADAPRHAAGERSRHPAAVE